MLPSKTHTKLQYDCNLMQKASPFLTPLILRRAIHHNNIIILETYVGSTYNSERRCEECDAHNNIETEWTYLTEATTILFSSAPFSFLFMLYVDMALPHNIVTFSYTNTHSQIYL